MNLNTLLYILSYIGIGTLIFLIVLGAIYLANRLRSAVRRHEIKAEFGEKKLRAAESLDFDIFYEELTNRPKALPPIRGEVMNPPVVDRCFDED